MNPFDLFRESEVYKAIILYFSKSRGLAIVGRHTPGEKIEVVQVSGEVDSKTGEFTALDYTSGDAGPGAPVLTKNDFDELVTFISSRIDKETRMSVIEPELMRAVPEECSLKEPGPYMH
jgi:hypothetical protein